MTQTQKGNLLIITQTVMWGIFPVITVLSLSGLGAFTSLGLSCLVATIFFGALVAKKKTFKNFFQPNVLKYLFIISFILGLCYYGLTFLALKNISPTNALLLTNIEILFAYLFFQVYKKENLDTSHLLGCILMVAGASLILSPKLNNEWSGSIWLIVIASAIAPIGNHYTQKARKLIGSVEIMLARSIFTTIFALLIAFLIGENINLLNINSSLMFLLVNGLFLLGVSKIFWIEGIHRIPVTKALGLGSLSPAFTLLFSYLILNQKPTMVQLIAFPLITIGLIMLLNTKNNRGDIIENV